MKFVKGFVIKLFLRAETIVRSELLNHNAALFSRRNSWSAIRKTS